MSDEFPHHVGEYLVRLARRSVKHFFETGMVLSEEPPYPEAREPSGAFVTIKRQDGELRGCIGYPLPIKPLYQAVIETALLAAFDDPRFPPLRYEELPHVLFEVSILTPPREVPKEELPHGIEIGRDGLIVEGYGRSGLLLPQVAVEEGWDPETFLDHTCIKAGLPPGCWKDPKIKVKKFSSIVFAETEPEGPVVRLL
ncbi:MAG: AmmeMemoRadiSam system protein A [Candidatus Diapherotrites archaeon]|nr:AmmeMemoRadiSam system protein A [Candidatus Diapherotrites archaeon]